METSDEATSRADMRLGPIGQFAVKTVIVAGAIVVSAWIMLDVLDDFADRRCLICLMNEEVGERAKEAAGAELQNGFRKHVHKRLVTRSWQRVVLLL